MARYTIGYKEIEDYPGYFVYEDGRVLALPSGSILKPILKKDGYSSVCLYRDKKQKYLKIHRLVAEAFIPNPMNKLFVNHIDFDRANNCLGNLEWVTSSENALHSARHGRNSKQKKFA